MIKIKVSDKLLLTSLAYVLDREGVPERIFEIRICWGIGTDFISPKNFHKWLAADHPELNFTKEGADYYGNKVEQFEIESSRNKDVTIEELQQISELSKFNIVQFEVELLMKKFGINPKHKKMIIKAIVCNEVDEKDINQPKEGFGYDFLLDSQELRFAIEKNYESKQKIEINRDRGWYYRSKEYMQLGTSFRKSYQIIAGEVGEDEDKIKLQIKRYKKFILG